MLSISNLKNYVKHSEMVNSINLNDDINNKVVKLYLDSKNLVNRNIRNIASNRETQIYEILSKNVFEEIDNQLTILNDNGQYVRNQKVQNLKIGINLYIRQIEELITHSDIKNIFDIKNMFNISCFERYLIKDDNLELIGSCDEIEVLDGHYYPIDYNLNNGINEPSEAEKIKLCLNAMLIEQEFDTEVFCGFISFIRTNERVQVVFDSKLRKKCFKFIHEFKNSKEE
jgi:CRISPR-associated exonuclease Cas4